MRLGFPALSWFASPGTLFQTYWVTPPRTSGLPPLGQSLGPGRGPGPGRLVRASSPFFSFSNIVSYLSVNCSFAFHFHSFTRVCYLSSTVCLLLLQHYPYRLVDPAQHLWTSQQQQLVMWIFLHFAFNHNHRQAHAHGKDRKDRCVSLTSLRLIMVGPMCT